MASFPGHPGFGPFVLCLDNVVDVQWSCSSPPFSELSSGVLVRPFLLPVYFVF